MFSKYDTDGFVPLISGIRMKVVGHGAHTLTALFLLDDDVALPRHEHIHEQTGILLEGKMTLTIGGETYKVSPGDTWSIPPNVPHEAKTSAYCRAMEVFSPPREDFLKLAGILKE
jgi:quercetin dioxygenase-like cupin family protein